MSTQCRFCGEAVRPDSMFCPACGQLIGAVAGAVPPFPGADAAPAQRAAAPAQPAQAIDPVPLPARQRAKAAAGSQQEAAQPDPTPAPAPAEPPAPAEQSAPPAPAEQAQEPQPVEPPIVSLPTTIALPDGQRLTLESALVFGRSPEQGAAAHGGAPIRLHDPQRAMSRVHLVVAPVAGGVTATDPGSANGTLLERAGTQYALVAGTPTSLVPGDRLLLGDAALRIF